MPSPHFIVWPPRDAQCRTDQKTLLLFIIRDHVGATPLANLSATLTADIERIWTSVIKVSIPLSEPLSRS